jgi:hypothetical protein
VVSFSPSYSSDIVNINVANQFQLAYTTYAFFEWALIVLDVAFDAVTALDFGTFEISIKDVKGSSKGYVQWLPR